MATGDRADAIKILHFNDVMTVLPHGCDGCSTAMNRLRSWIPQVYNIGENKSEPVGGAARFATLLGSFAASKPLITFGGDALSPSESTCDSRLLVRSGGTVQLWEWTHIV